MTVANNLPSGSQPWGREVEQRLATLERGLKSANDNVLANNKGTNGTLGQLAKQISVIAAQQAALQTTQSVLQSQQSALSAQQATLTDAVNRLSSAEGSLVRCATSSNYTASPIGVSSGGSYTPTTVSVPVGYSTAVVTGITSVVISGTNPVATVATTINGNQGYALPVYATVNGSFLANGAMSHAYTITNLSAGMTITTRALFTQVSSVNNAYIINTQTVIFLK